MSDHDRYPDSYLRDILERVKTIALVGASDNPARPSFGVLHYLIGRGYRVVPVNPKLAGHTITGEPVFGRLADVPEPIDMVDVFRNTAAVPGLIDEVLALGPRPSVVWMQLGVRDEASAVRAEAAGIDVVMDRCPKIEIARLLGP